MFWMNVLRTHTFTGLVLVFVSLIVGSVSAQTPPPSLIVILAVDQMRSDSFERYGEQWSAGLRRLLDEGAVFREAKYSYLSLIHI